MTFRDVLAKYHAISFSERDKGDRFERLMCTNSVDVTRVGTRGFDDGVFFQLNNLSLALEEGVAGDRGGDEFRADVGGRVDLFLGRHGRGRDQQGAAAEQEFFSMIFSAKWGRDSRPGEKRRAQDDFGEINMPHGKKEAKFAAGPGRRFRATTPPRRPAA